MVIAFGMSSTIALETATQTHNDEQAAAAERAEVSCPSLASNEDQRRRARVSRGGGARAAFPSPRERRGDARAPHPQLTSVEILHVLGLVVAGVPAVVLAALAHLDHEAALVVVPLVALHS